MLLTELEDFVAGHRACDQLMGDATEPEPSGYMLTETCSCGVVFMRWVTPDLRRMAHLGGNGWRRV